MIGHSDVAAQQDLGVCLGGLLKWGGGRRWRHCVGRVLRGVGRAGDEKHNRARDGDPRDELALQSVTRW